MHNTQIVTFLKGVTELLRGVCPPTQFRQVILPFVVLRRLDCVLVPTKAQVVAAHQCLTSATEAEMEAHLQAITGLPFYNHFPFTFETLKSESPTQLAESLMAYVRGFSGYVRSIFEAFEMEREIQRLNTAHVLPLLITRFASVNLHPDAVDNLQMGLVFEELTRYFLEAAGEEIGDYFTPREVVELMTRMLFAPDTLALTAHDAPLRLFDPTCGTGGMLAEAQGFVRAHHPHLQVMGYGQDFNPYSYAVAASDALMRGEYGHIRLGDSLTADQFSSDQFHYFLANPPYGVDWKRQSGIVRQEYEQNGAAGRFGAGLPRVSDGALLFLQHMISKFTPVTSHLPLSGSRLAVIFNGSPLFTGDAGSGENSIRRWLVENDWLETIVALPEQLFYNTGIGTYLWIVTNRKEERRKGKIQLIDARTWHTPMRRNLGNKRRYLDEVAITAILDAYSCMAESDTSKVFPATTFGYTRVQIERPLRLTYRMDAERKSRFLDAVPHLLDDVQAIDLALGRAPVANWNKVSDEITTLLATRHRRWKATEWKLFRSVFTDVDPAAAPVVAHQRPHCSEGDNRVWGWFQVDAMEYQYEPNPALRDHESIPLQQEIVAYFRQEVEPHVADGWMVADSLKVGYEFNVARWFYKYTPPRPLAEIDAELRQLHIEMMTLFEAILSPVSPMSTSSMG